MLLLHLLRRRRRRVGLTRLSFHLPLLPSLLSLHIHSTTTNTTTTNTTTTNTTTTNTTTTIPTDDNSSEEIINPTPPRVVPSPEADALSHILLRHHNPFHAMESPLQLLGVTLSHDLVLQTLLRLRHASKPALAFFVWARDHAFHQHDSCAYDLAIDIVARARQFDVAWQLLLEMDQRATDPPSPRTFAILARRLIAAGFTRQAVRAFDDMEAFVGRPPTAAELVTLLDTLSKYGYVKVATEIFNQRKSTYEFDEKAYTVLIYGWCKINRLGMARKFLQEIWDSGMEPNVVTYNVMLNGICRRASLHPDTRFDRTIQEAESLMEEMQSRGIQPDVTSYSIVLHVYSRAHKPELTLLSFRRMKEMGISPTIASYTSVIKCLASCGRLEEAERLLEDMLGDGICPSPATYNCFFKEYRGRRDADGSIKLYRKMKQAGSPCVPDLHTYNILLGTFARLDKMELLQEIWDDMDVSGTAPDLDSYTLMVHALCGRQKWRAACQFFMQMIEKGILPQKITFETLYRGLIQSDKLRTWRRLQKRLEEESARSGTEFWPYRFKPYRR